MHTVRILRQNLSSRPQEKSQYVPILREMRTTGQDPSIAGELPSKAIFRVPSSTEKYKSSSKMRRDAGNHYPTNTIQHKGTAAGNGDLRTFLPSVEISRPSQSTKEEESKVKIKQIVRKSTKK